MRDKYYKEGWGLQGVMMISRMMGITRRDKDYKVDDDYKESRVIMKIRITEGWWLTDTLGLQERIRRDKYYKGDTDYKKNADYKGVRITRMDKDYNVEKDYKEERWLQGVRIRRV